MDPARVDLIRTRAAEWVADGVTPLVVFSSPAAASPCSTERTATVPTPAPSAQTTANATARKRFLAQPAARDVLGNEARS